MADKRDLAKVELFDHRREIAGEGVVIVAPPGVARSSVAATVVSDAAQPLVGQVNHLVLPHVGVERPTVDEDDGLAGAPVLIEQARAITGYDEWRPDSVCGRGFCLRSFGLRRAACGD